MGKALNSSIIDKTIELGIKGSVMGIEPRVSVLNFTEALMDLLSTPPHNIYCMCKTVKEIIRSRIISFHEEKF
jgi:hypothetical protein